jgi:hypothetical protein
VITLVDGLEERLQVSLGPRLLGRRDEHEGKMSTGQAQGERAVEPLVFDRDDPGLHRAFQRGQMIDQGRDDRLGTVDRQVGEQEDADACIGQRIALKVAVEGVVDFLAGGHSCSRRR